MNDIKSFLFYLVSLLGLIGASLLFANQGDPPEIKSLYATATPASRSSRATSGSPAAEKRNCADTAQGVIFAHVPDVSSRTNSKNDRLSISGTIYASDGVTPLPGVLVQVRPASPLNERESYAFNQIRTGAGGRYTFIKTKPHPHIVLTIHYQDQVSYQNTCLLSMRLKVMSMSLTKSPSLKNTKSSAPTLRKLSLDNRIAEAGPVFHGPIDLVLPVSPPLSE